MNARSHLIAPKIYRVAQLDGAVRKKMYDLYERYYGNTDFSRFSSDLANKDFVLLLFDETESLQGFSALTVYERQFEGREIRVVFSGDTVVDERHWGQQALALSWLRLAGQIKAEKPEQPLYWLLISKGHRTYRYLSAFSHDFYPAPDRTTPHQTLELMHFLARDRFGEAYDPVAGILRFPQSLGNLRAEYAQIPQAHLRLRVVEFFLERNPGYANGEELVCLCELSATNLRPIARRAFLAGIASATST